MLYQPTMEHDIMNDQKIAFRGLMTANFVLHMVSAVFAGIWISDMLAPDGVMHVIDWVKVSLSVIALAIGLTFSSYIALKFIVNLPDKIKHPAKIVFVTVYVMIALVLAVASASVLASAAGERAHMERTLDRYRDAIEERRRATSDLLNRAPALNDCVTTAKAMSEEEANSGAFSEVGRNVGRVSITIQNVGTGCDVALRALFGSRAILTRQFQRAERILMEARQVIDGDQDRAQKLIRVRKLMHELGGILRNINDAFPTEALQSASDATSKDWFAIGLPERAAIALTGNFSGVGDRVTEGLDDVTALKTKRLPKMEVVPAMAYLALYPQATIGSLVIGIMIEALPLGTILLGFVLLGRKEDDDQAAIIVAPKARTAKRGRAAKNGGLPTSANDTVSESASNAA
jgi:hypothetical protein